MGQRGSRLLSIKSRTKPIKKSQSEPILPNAPVNNTWLNSGLFDITVVVDGRLIVKSVEVFNSNYEFAARDLIEEGCILNMLPIDATDFIVNTLNHKNIYKVGFKKWNFGRHTNSIYDMQLIVTGLDRYSLNMHFLTEKEIKYQQLL
ncbi:hypothetical protein AKO1_013969 [Acrasis kona]|uniref:Uncharacterized protein n=1 Tax=Acrasis kona TaxID=1008807 RepID=A0AAW2Z366_9EUKA